MLPAERAADKRRARLKCISLGDKREHWRRYPYVGDHGKRHCDTAAWRLLEGSAMIECNKRRWTALQRNCPRLAPRRQWIIAAARLASSLRDGIAAAAAAVVEAGDAGRRSAPGRQMGGQSAGHASVRLGRLGAGRREERRPIIEWPDEKDRVLPWLDFIAAVSLRLVMNATTWTIAPRSRGTGPIATSAVFVSASGSARQVKLFRLDLVDSMGDDRVSAEESEFSLSSLLDTEMGTSEFFYLKF